MNVASVVTALKGIRLSLDLLITTLEGEQASSVIPKEVLLNAMCMGIQKFEGWFPGSRSQRNKNPGNLVYVGQEKARKEAGVNGRFAVFETYEDGFNALKKMILNAANGKSSVYKPTMTLYEFFAKYAPATDNNNPDVYAEYVAKNMSVDPHKFLLSQLV